MFNLIRKDIILQKSTLTILLLVYLLLGVPSIHGGVTISIIVIMSVYTMDEKSSIHMLLNSLPYTRKEIVSSKYMGACIITCLVAVILFIVNLIFYQEIIAWREILLIISLVMVAMSLIFPFVYRFKSQYILMVALMLGFIYVFVRSTYIPNLNVKTNELVQMVLTLQTAQFYLFIVLSAIALYTCSWLLSIYIYRKKVF
ncbi:ABC-2 transporter permease [Sporosarcina sp. FSL K6-2383]|uniref:ABC-2 transporter permease n=1 Tax=Sporosarcina sp. FSL K6-2383 TaxID=2921556 RepID=UPI00315AB6AC